MATRQYPFIKLTSDKVVVIDDLIYEFNSKKELLTHLKRKASVLKPVPRFLTKKKRKYSAGLTL